MGLEPGSMVKLNRVSDRLVVHRPVAGIARVLLEPTTRCNLRCRTYMRNVWEEPIGDMDEHTFKRVLKSVKALPHPPTVFFGGLGETDPATFIYKLSMINSYAMGASLFALFARTGGGIYTKGADMGADLLESYVESIIAIQVTTFDAEHLPMVKSIVQVVLSMAAAGIIASVLGVFYVKIFARRNPQKALLGGTYVAAVLSIILSIVIIWKMGVDFFWATHGGVLTYSKWGLLWSTVAGIVSGIIIGLVSEIYTSGGYKPVRKLAANCETGPAIGVVGGISEMADLPESVRNITDKLDSVGDTVGDPMKDTIVPSANILIKLMCVISLVMVPFLRELNGVIWNLF